jgi:four helix bundle protein
LEFRDPSLEFRVLSLAMSIRAFEDLIVWQRARVLVGEVYGATSPPGCCDFAFANQIQQAAVSVMSNMAEGFERQGPRAFYRFLSIAKESCGEVRSLSFVAMDKGSFDRDSFDRLMSGVADVARLRGALCVSVGRKCSERPSSHRGPGNSAAGTRRISTAHSEDQ